MLHGANRIEVDGTVIALMSCLMPPKRWKGGQRSTPAAIQAVHIPWTCPREAFEAQVLDGGLRCKTSRAHWRDTHELIGKGVTQVGGD